MTATTDTPETSPAPAAAARPRRTRRAADAPTARTDLTATWRAAEKHRPRAGSRHELMLGLLQRAGWGPDQVERGYQMRPPREPAAVSRRRHHGSREDRVAYLLSARPEVPTAVIATVGGQHDPQSGLPRAIRQATKLDAPLAYAANGLALVEHFIASGQTRRVDELASPARAWRSYLRLHHLRRAGARLVSEPVGDKILPDAEGPGRLRYYQTAAANRALGAISRGRPRILLHLPAGAGATTVAAAVMAKFAAYQLATRPDRHCGLLYLDDRSVADSAPQTLAVLRRLAGTTAADLTIGALGDRLDQLGPNDVDLAVVNLVHGGSAADPPTWRAILDRFPAAFQVGIAAASPAQAPAVYEHFGRPIYRYTADQARSDGYLPAIAASAPDPADSAPADSDLESAFAAPAAPRGRRSPWRPFPGARDPRDPVAVAVQIRRSVEYADLAAGQQALAAQLVSLLRLANQPGPAARAAARRAGQLTELEILAELEDQAGGEQAVLHHITLLRNLLA
ncbi:MAG: hypothetical protein LBG60_06940 [Bifidobacteriaceae bacterium]|jgi:hypothetical protein|nr:hypothetical protein [Bifidobacteriaceae bacterium]